ncbi:MULTISPECIES: DUF2191 domain-containing protein [unclassified Streptomyces]|uniref:DUF2191 domain-containing protein n=1 Tax=unclassified Streptomyces TaxID=2593676 RepID=UPI0033D2DCB3
MVLAGDGSPRDTVGVAVYDRVARGHPTEARAAAREEPPREADVRPRDRPG